MKAFGLVVFCSISLPLFGASSITSPLTANGQVGNSFSYTITASNLTMYHEFYLSALPDGLSFNATTDTISGAPTTGGVFSVRITSVADVTAPVDYSNSAILTITISGGNGAPVIVGNNIQGIQGVPIIGGITATGATPITFSYSALPAGLSGSANTVVGSPAISSTTTVTVTASNSIGNGSAPIQIITTSGSPLITSPLSITCVAGPGGGPFYTLTAIGDSPLTFSIDPTKLPRGLVIDAFAPNLLVGYPFDMGIYTVPVTVSNAKGQTSGAITITATMPDNITNENLKIQFSEALKQGPGTGTNKSVTTQADSFKISGTIGLNGFQTNQFGKNSYFALEVGHYPFIALLGNGVQSGKSISATFKTSYGDGKLKIVNGAALFSVSLKAKFGDFSPRAADYAGKTLSVSETLPVLAFLTLDDLSDAAFIRAYAPVTGKSSYRTAKTSTISTGTTLLRGTGDFLFSGSHVKVNVQQIIDGLSAVPVLK